MRYEDVAPEFRKALGYWEAFRKLGFASSQISVHLDTQVKILVVVLEAQGKQFAVGAARCGLTHEEFEENWIRVATAVRENVLPDEDLDRIWTESMPYRESYDFVMAILKKGIKLGSTLN